MSFRVFSRDRPSSKRTGQLPPLLPPEEAPVRLGNTMSLNTNEEDGGNTSSSNNTSSNTITRSAKPSTAMSTSSSLHVGPPAPPAPPGSGVVQVMNNTPPSTSIASAVPPPPRPLSPHPPQQVGAATNAGERHMDASEAVASQSSAEASAAAASGGLSAVGDGDEASPALPLPPPLPRRTTPMVDHLPPEERELVLLKHLLLQQSDRCDYLVKSTPDVPNMSELLPEGEKQEEVVIEPIDEEDVEAVVASTTPAFPLLEVKNPARYFLQELHPGKAPQSPTSKLHRDSEMMGQGTDRTPFATELQQLCAQMSEREKRMNIRFADLKKHWVEPLGEGIPIPPEPPSVFSADTDDEVREKAQAAEDFVKNHTNRVKLRKKMEAEREKGLNTSNSVSGAYRRGSYSMKSLNIFSDSCRDSVVDGMASGDPARMSSSESPMHSTEHPLSVIALDHVFAASGLKSEQPNPEISEGARAILAMLENRAEIVLPSPSITSTSRLGDVLSTTHILKLDLLDALRNREGPRGVIAGAPYFRIVPKFNIAGVSQANVSAIRTILNELKRAHIESPVIWVNLREEPLVYIHNASHIVRERNHPLDPIIIPNVTGRGIEVVEAKLKHEVLVEAMHNGGNLSVYVEEKSDLVEDQWVSADLSTVMTVSEVFSSIARNSYGPVQLQYYRRPVTQNIGPQPEHFDFVLEACIDEPKAVFVFNCQTGRGRTSAMIQIACIVRFYQLCVKDVAADGRLLRSGVTGPKFKTIQKLISLFPDGKLHERRVLTLMEMTDKTYSMVEHINESFMNQNTNPDEAMMRLQLYAYFLVFSYYCEQRLWNYATKETFEDWLKSNPEIQVLILSIRDQMSDQLQGERVAPSDEGFDAHVMHIIRHRAGNVLSSGRILCSMSTPKDEVPRNLRQLAAGVPLFTCGRMGERARYTLVQSVKKAFPTLQNVYWLSVRAEPHVVINGFQYTLADANSASWTTEVGTSMHVSLRAIEQMEDRLRRDVLLEAQENRGQVLLHHINSAGEVLSQMLKITSVKTPKSVMEEFAMRSGVNYHRVPVPFPSQMLPSDVDPLLKYLSEGSANLSDIFVINDWEGGIRTSVALNIITLYRASRVANLRSLQAPMDLVQHLKEEQTDELGSMALIAPESDSIPESPIEVLLASTICQMLTAGTLIRTVSAAIELGGSGKEYNILHYLDHLKTLAVQQGKHKPQTIHDALRALRSYLLVLASALYIENTSSSAQELSFSAWVHARKEVSNIISNLDARGESALKYVNADNLMKADVSRRCGDVLTANFCLKADHFPGCQKKGLHPEVCGAPNFRKVYLLNVYGVAITTLVGVHNVLSLLGATDAPMKTYPGQQNGDDLYRGFAAPRLFDPMFKPEELQRPLRGFCVWINLREEPILYVGDRPFVFRDLAAPYVNVELTGIQTEKIEHVENQLKMDVLNEADEYGGKFLVHDEASPGELVGMWEPASEDTVKTTREVYTEVVDKGYRCTMLRMPVTDEQSPEMRDFDLLVNALLPRIAEHMDRRETLSFVFNCQMGRGRTTTGMVICCLLIGLVIPEYFIELDNIYKPLFQEGDSELSKGNYGIVNQLKRVLIHGRVAKHRVDLVLEACSKMQNLRTAIESFVINLRSPDVTEEQRARSHHAGIHYLVRYFNLIVFCVYLEEEYDRMQKKMKTTFVDWMASHPEVVTISSSARLQ